MAQLTAQDMYTPVANDLLAAIKNDVATQVPEWEQSFITPEIESFLAGTLSKVAVDKVLALQTTGASSGTITQGSTGL